MTEPQSDRTVGEVRVRRVLPLYLVVFVGFVGYSLMIAIFTPRVLRVDGRMLPHDTSAGARAIALGVLLAVYPLAQFLGAPVIGGLSDRFGRKPTLLVSLTASAACYGLIALAVDTRTFELLLVACFIAGLAEANVAVLAFTALAFTETSVHPRRDEPISVTRAFTSLGDAARPGRMRRLFLTNFVLYLSIFGFFRVYPMYLINRFHMTVARESLSWRGSRFRSSSRTSAWSAGWRGV